MAFQSLTGVKASAAKATSEGKGKEYANGDGTGLKYIKARLQDCYPDRWSLRAGPVAEGWRTLITIEES